MLGLFGTLNLGARALAAQQMGSEVAGNNLANVDNPAYARQRLNLASSLPTPSSIGPEGNGVDAVSISQVRDSILDGQITSEASINGSLTAQQTALDNAEANLGEQLDTSATGTSGTATTGGQTGLATGLNNLFAAFQSLSTDPSSLAQRQVLIGNAQNLASQFNQVSAQLSSVHDGLNTSITNDVAGANQDLSDIAELNKQITYSEAATGGTANDLRDERQQKLEDLASKVSFTSTPQSNGGVNITIGGVSMVSGQTVNDQLQTYDAGGGQLMVQAQNAGTPLTLTGGSIQGSISVRDGSLESLQGNVNALAGQLITQVNAIHSAGYDLNGNTGQPFFSGSGAADISVNSALVADPSKVQASATAGATGDNTVALQLAQLANSNISALGNQTFTQSYSQTVATLGQAISSTNDQITNQGAISSMLNNQRASVSGVSLDEEMTNLMQFQKAYQASAQLITTVNAMLVTVIAMKTV